MMLKFRPVDCDTRQPVVGTHMFLNPRVLSQVEVMVGP